MENLIFWAMAVSSAAYLWRWFVKLKRKREHFLATLQPGQHIKARKQVKGKDTICHTWIRKINADKKTVHTPIGEITFGNIY